MKKQIRFIILIALPFFLCSASAQQGWFWQNPTPQGNSILSISFLDSFNGVAAGEYGTAIKTTDGGFSWAFLYSDPTYYFRTVKYLSTGNILILATTPPVYQQNILFRSTNGGKTWDLQVLDSAYQYQGMSFLDSVHGVIVGARGTILSTTDGGYTWYPQTSGSVRSLSAASFSDLENGFVVGEYGEILRTTNGGFTWSHDSGAIAVSYYAVSSIDSLTATACGGGSVIIRTSDGGKTWMQQNQGTYYSLSSIAASHDGVVVAAGVSAGGGNIISSTNSGASWKDTTYGPDEFKCIAFTDSTTLIAMGLFGTVYRSSDRGVTWLPIVHKIDDTNFGVHFCNHNFGMIGGLYDVLQTADGGSTWTRRYVGIQMYVEAVHVIDTSFAIAVGSPGNVLRTTDGGQSWDSLWTSLYDLYAVDFINRDLGMVVGGGGQILKTTDGGLSWATLTSGTTLRLTGIKMLSTSTAIAVGQGYSPPTYSTYVGIILRTTNGGGTWNAVLSGESISAMDAVDFMTPLNGIAVGAEIYRSTNAGQNWHKVVNVPSAYSGLYSVSFSDQNNGFASGFTGKILSTTNGGVDWTSQVSYTGRNLYGVFANGPQQAVAVGERSTILRTVTGGVTTGVEVSPKFVSSPSQFTVSQNYPNPFNPSTVIEFDLRVASEVSLVVFDILGRKVATLVNEYQRPGRKSVTFQGENLPSGVYYYRITTGNQTNVNKMILLK